MKSLNKYLSKLKKNGATSIKQSLEDEGSSFDDLMKMRTFTKKNNLNLNVKIGGCEAKNDIFFCQHLKVDSIVAPMVESDYALTKFISCIGKKINAKYLLILRPNLLLKTLKKLLIQVLLKN